MIVAALTTVLLGQVAAVPAQPAQPATPVQLARVFKKGESCAYSFWSELTAEMRQPGLLVFLPRTYGYEYTFTTNVKSVDADGNAQLVYERPKMVFIQGAFGDEEEVRRVEKGGEAKVDAKVTTINEIIDIKEIKPPAKPGAKPKLLLMRPGAIQQTDAIAGQFLADIYRLSLMVGSLDSSMDFAPKLPFMPVKPGATWKKTVGYSPQKLNGSAKSAVQRLDYVYTYDGLVDVNGKKFQRISATLNLDTDMAEYINQLYGLKPSESGLKSLKTKFESKIRFDLDPVTFRTVLARSESKGSTNLEVTFSSAPLEEQKFFGESELKLVKVK